VGVVRAVELGVVGMKSKGEFKECKTHEAAADEATADEEEDGEAAASEEEKDDKEIAGEGETAARTDAHRVANNLRVARKLRRPARLARK